MDDVAPGGAGSLQVNRATLEQAAEQAGQVSHAVGRLAADVSPACSPAVSAHSGWGFGRALSAVVPVWERHLHRQSLAVSAAGEKLTRSAAAYANVENGLVARARAIYSRPAG
jgi:hypothetical protein